MLEKCTVQFIGVINIESHVEQNGFQYHSFSLQINWTWN